MENDVNYYFNAFILKKYREYWNAKSVTH